MSRIFIVCAIILLGYVSTQESVASSSQIASEKQLSPNSQKVIRHVNKGLKQQKKAEKKQNAGRVDIDRFSVRAVELNGATEGAAGNAEGEVEAASPYGISIKSANQKNAGVDKLIEQAYQALIAGQYEVAVTLYKRALKKSPDNTLASFGLATTYHRATQLEEARNMYEHLLKLNPGHKEALNNFLVLIAEEAPQDAILQLKKMEKLHPAYSPIQAQIGMIYANLGENTKAIQHLEKAISLSPENVSYRYNLAVLFDRMGNKKHAIRSYHQVIDFGLQGNAIPSSVQKIQDRIIYLSKK